MNYKCSQKIVWKSQIMSSERVFQVQQLVTELIVKSNKRLS